MDNISRTPRSLVLVNDTVVQGLEAWNIENNAFYEADTFSVTLAVSSLVAPLDAATLTDGRSLKVEIFEGIPSDPDNFTAKDLTSRVIGNVDVVGFDPVQRTIELSGRDFTSLYIDTKTTEKWPNKTASQIVKILAERHGMTPIVTETKEQVGTYYTNDHVVLTDARSEWDLLTWLATFSRDEKGDPYTVFVSGKELHFQPQVETKDPFVIEWVPANDASAYPEANVEHISFSRNLTTLRDVSVVVRSWNGKQKKAFERSYPASKPKGISPGKSGVKQQVYSYTIPGLTDQQCLQKAISIHKQITAHEVRFDARLPMQEGIVIGRQIKCTGTGTAFDQLYYPESITRSFSTTEGHGISIAAKNHSPESQVTI